MVIANIITGPLGSGKTTAILALIKRKPLEKWAVLVNEIGDVGVDGAVMGDVAVREIAGGCVCCANGVPFRVAVTQLVRNTRPDRLLVEPSGLGRPSVLRKMLREIGLEVRATVCLVPADMEPGGDAYEDQLHAADVLLITRRDVAVDDRAERAARDFFPPKVVALAERGEFDASLLDEHATAHVVLPDDHDHGGTTRVDRADGSVRFESTREGRRLVGWVFDDRWTFDLDVLLAEAMAPLDRGKAVVRTKLGAFSVHWHNLKASATPVPRTADDSRVQFIFPEGERGDECVDRAEEVFYRAASKPKPAHTPRLTP